MGRTKTYDPNLVLASFAGFQITGYAEDMIKVERNEDSITLVVGADGESARTINRNKSGQVTFTLLQTSSANDMLEQQADLDELTGLGMGELQIIDLNGTSQVSAQLAWVKKRPSQAYGKTSGNREWVLETGELDQFVGGQG